MVNFIGSAKGNSVVDSGLEQASVLVVDDNEMNVDLLVNMLERQNYRIYTAKRGDAALEIVKEKLPDIVLLDINMPHMSGYEVCTIIKDNPETADIPVIFISALGDTVSLLKGFEVGGVDYITKPFKFREVLARVDTQLTLAYQKKQIENMRRREKQQFERMDKLRTQFIGSATHDLKNPLFVISGYADMLEMTPEIAEDAQILGFVNSIQRGVERMSGLVYDMLDLLQLETEVTLEKMPINLREFLDETTHDMAFRAQNKDIVLDVHHADDDAKVHIDYSRMRRVLDNVVSNAIKYTPQGGTVDVVTHVEDDAVIIEIIDSGLGIPEENLEQIFQPFERVQSEDHMQQEGTGLGLSIVKTLVEQHHGIIEVESELGKGSCFRIILPR